MTKQKQKQKRKVNPFANGKLLRRVPRPRLSFDGTVLNGNFDGNAPSTASFQAADWFNLDCSSTWGVSRQFGVVANTYNQYRYKSITFEWVPKVGPGHVDAGSTVALAFFDNSELIANYINTWNVAQRQQAVFNTSKLVIFNAWERFKWKVPITSRRKRFPVDYTPGTVTLNDIERATQGMLGIALTSMSTAAVLLGYYHITYELELYGLDITGT